MLPSQTDVLIVGAGPAGATAALFLAQKGISCVLADKEQFPRDKVCGDALSGKTVEILNRLDKNWVNELAGHKSFLDSYGVTFVAPNGKALRVPFGKNHPSTPPGFISKRIDFDSWLVDKVRTQANITFEERLEIRKYEQDENGITAFSKDGRTISAKIVIAADGAYSSFAKDIAGLTTEPEHNCFGLRAYYKNVTGLDSENFIELHFLKEILPCYFWIFPLPDGIVNVGIGIRASDAKKKNINLKRAFEKILENNASIRKRFKNAERIGEVKLAGLPLGSRKRNLSGERYMLCGDAAQLIDPFTGEGIGNAMMSGMLAAQQAEQSLRNQQFSKPSMSRYDAEVYRRLWPELLLSEKLSRMVNFPGLFNFVVNRANSSPVMRETISGMFNDLDVRARLKSPRFYWDLLFS